ncbi:MAG: hypothetical protein AAF430_04190 [Myxococcota bacterium]
MREPRSRTGPWLAAERRLGLWLALGPALLSAGCLAPIHLYDGPPKPFEEVAIIDAPGDATILQVDGQSIPRLESTVAVLPDTHVLLFRVRTAYKNLGDGGSTDGSTVNPQHVVHCFIKAPFEAGHQYTIRSRLLEHNEQVYKRGWDMTRHDPRLQPVVVDTATEEPLEGLRCNQPLPGPQHR